MRNLTPDQDRALSIIIKSHEIQIRDLELTAADGKFILSQSQASELGAFQMHISLQTVEGLEGIHHCDHTRVASTDISQTQIDSSA